MHKRKQKKATHKKSSNNISKSTPQKEQVQKGQIEKGIIESRIEEYRIEDNKKINENPSLRKSYIESLLFKNHPEEIKKVPGNLEFLDYQLRSSKDYIAELVLLAVRSNSEKSLEYLLNSYKDLMVSNSKTIDIFGVLLKNSQETDKLIKSIDFKREDGKTLLHRAVDINNIELIRNISDLDPSMINKADNKGLTPLDYALIYLKKDLAALHPFRDRSDALKILKSKSDMAILVVENLIKNHHNYQNKQNNKKPTILKNDQLRNKILQEFNKLDASPETNKIDFPKDIHPIREISQGNKFQFDVLSTYYRIINCKSYSKQDWQLIKGQVASAISNISSYDNNIKLLDMAFEFFVILTKDLTYDNFIECYFGNSRPDNISDVKTKYYLLSKLALYNTEHHENNLALSQSSEALKLAENLNDNEMMKQEWYQDSMYITLTVYANCLQKTNKYYQNSDVLVAIEKAGKYVPSSKKFFYNLNKFITYVNMHKFDSPELQDLIDNIGDVEMQNFFGALKEGVIIPGKLFESDMDVLVSKISDMNKRESCQALLSKFRSDSQHLIGQYEDAFYDFMERKDIASIARTCFNYSSPKLVRQALELINNHSKYLEKSVRHELFQISKTLIYFSASKFELALESLITTNTDEWGSLANDWKDLFCLLISSLALDHNQNIGACIKKLEQVDPNHSMLEIMRFGVETDSQAEENSIEAEDCTQVSDKASDQISKHAAVPAIEYLTKNEVLGLSERDFLNESKAGRIKLGLQKSYYKQLKQNQLKQDIIDSVEKCFSKKGQENEEIESWILPSNKVFKTDDSQVVRVDDKTWAVIDDGTKNALDFAYRIAFENAITKGFVRSKGTNGIKIIENIAELKIKSDLRLYTKIKCVNDHGASLIIFDKSGNHKEIKKELNHKEGMLCYKVPSVSKDDSHIADSLNNSTITLEESILNNNHQDHDVSSLGQCEDNTL